MSQVLFRSPDEVTRYVRKLSARRVEDDRGVKIWEAARRLTWIMLLAGSFLIYYLVAAVTESLSLPQVVVSVPVKATGSDLPPRPFR